MATTVETNMRAVDDQKNFAYFGERGHWLMVIGQHRDSEALTRSNFRVIHKDLAGKFPGAIEIERFNHPLVGWTESVLVDPANAEAVEAAAEWQAHLDDYIYADGDDLSELEDEETHENIEQCGKEAVRMGHSAPPEDWENENGYYYAYTCEHCGQEIGYSSDSGSWTLPDCVEEE